VSRFRWCETGGPPGRRDRKRDEQADDTPADTPPRDLGLLLPALDSAALSLATGGIRLSGSIFFGRLHWGCHHYYVRWPELSCRDAEVWRAFLILGGLTGPSPSPAASSTKPSSIIASLRNVSWNLTVWPIRLPTPNTIPPRAGVSCIPPMA
jgi:hypothetical protein